jgi:ABC-type sugar transport system ATPase subunit/ribose/xylose/arabinose/galactoside ABC-type transport system permease subunit
VIPAIRFRAISKRFGGVQALDEVTFSVEPGTCHAVMGENGAGKSTLGKILAGIHSPDAGFLEVEGERHSFASPLDARRTGIALVHQEAAYCPNLSVAENIALGALPRHGAVVDERELNRKAVRMLCRVGAEFDARQPMSGLTIAQGQLVQIAAALATDARILIFDEPTSSVSRKDSAKLHEIIRDLRASGRTVLYITHRIEEVEPLCDSVTVLRDGRHVATKRTEETGRDEIVELMVGRKISPFWAAPPAVGPEMLRVEGLTSQGKFHDVSFSVREGEILGFAGLVGAGRSEIAAALFGLDTECSGAVFVGGRQVRIESPPDAIALGIGLVPEDRKKQGLVPQMSCAENLTLSSLPRFTGRGGFVRGASEKAAVRDWFHHLGIRAAGFDAPAASLSGGNQQKLTLGKWLVRDSRILILDEPTRGVDIAAKNEIHRLIHDLAQRGYAILLISSDLPELLALSTRVLAVRRGRTAGIVPREQATEESILNLMMGAASESAPNGTVPMMPVQTPTEREKGRMPSIRREPRMQELGLVIVLLLLAGMLTAFSGSVEIRRPDGHVVTENRFLRGENLDKLAKNASFFAIMAIGATLVIVTGGIDLSVGSVYCLAAVAGAMFLHRFGPSGPGANAPPGAIAAAAVLLCCAVGAVCGLVNGTLIVVSRVHPFVITLGTMAVFRGIAFVTTKAQSYTNFPAAFTTGFIRRQAGGGIYPVPYLMMFAVMIVASIYLRRMVGGREIYAVGGNEEAARYSGLRVGWIKIRVYMLAGLAAGIAAMIMLGYYGAASSDAGTGYELDVIAAAVVGGASLAGGKGTALGALLGAVLIQMIDNSIVLLNIDQNYSQIFIGSVIVAAVVLDRLNSAWRSRLRVRPGVEL